MKQKSGVPLPTIAWWGFQTLEFIAGEMRRDGEDFILLYDTLYPYMKDRRWNRREQNDVMGFMLREGWIHRKKHEDGYGWRYVFIDPTGRRELESPKQLQSLAVVNTVTDLSGPAAQRALLSQLALVIELDSRETPDPAVRARGEQLARDIEEDVSGNLKKRDVKIWLEMAKDLSQIAANANSALPLLHHMLSVILR